MAAVGVRTAAVEVIASATLASFIGAGGLGDFIVDGLATNDLGELLLGAAQHVGTAVAVDHRIHLSRRQFLDPVPQFVVLLLELMVEPLQLLHLLN